MPRLTPDPKSEIVGSSEAAPNHSLYVSIRRGVAWSALSTLTLRLAGFVVSIIVARAISVPEFGVYVVALTVQTILMTLADMGLSTDLIRVEDPDRIAPTVATFALLTGGGSATLMLVTAPLVASALGSPAAAPVIALLSVTLLLGGAGVVPYAMLQRRFQQGRTFAISIVDMTVGSMVTIALLLSGVGVMALAIGRVVAQVVVLILQFWLAGIRPRYGLNRADLPAIVSFGLPVAVANLLSWALLSVDNIVISRMLGASALGYYGLAFNVSSWPLSVVGQMSRAVALPALARTRSPAEMLGHGTALVWAAALPVGAFLGVLAPDLIEVVYGAKWLPSAASLGALATFGACRVVFDMFASLLLARGRSRLVLLIQLSWFFVLVPMTIAGAAWWGIPGAAWAHVAAAVGVAFPTYAYALAKDLGTARRLAQALWPPVLAVVPACLAARWVATTSGNALFTLVAGGLIAALIYVVILWGWVRRNLIALRTID